MGLYRSPGIWKCIYRRGPYIASGVGHFGGVGSLSGERCGCGITGFVGVVSDALCVWLLVWKASLSVTEAVSMLMGALMGETNLERHSAVLFLAPEIHSKVML